MAICNRDLGSAQQRLFMNTTLTNTITGQTYAVANASCPAQVVAAQISGNGLSGAPNVSLWIQRFIAGAGITTLSLGNSMVLTTFGTSGSQAFSMPNAASYLLQTGDVVTVCTAAANTATVSTTVTVVVQALQDIRTDFGV